MEKIKNETVFTKIKNGEIPSVKIYEDDVCFVILDINPVAKGHCLVISNIPYTNILQTPDDTVKHLISVAKKADKKLRDTLHCDGTNILINNDKASGQEVPHLHIHVIPRYNNDGKSFCLSHEKYIANEAEDLGRKLSF